jgi:membrane associated rhomboid family serine protease
MGAAFVLQRARGIDPMQSGLGPVILLNLGLTFVISNISIGGHIGGLVGGALAALLIDRVRSAGAAVAVCAAIGLAAAVGGIWAADREATQLGVALLQLVF